MRSLAVVLTIVLALPLLALPVFALPLPGAGSWPQFRGPNGSGIAVGSEPLPTDIAPDRHVVWEEGGAVESAADGAGSGLEGSGGPDFAAPGRGVERAELSAALSAAIATLPQGQREVLMLREIDGLSYAEIAEALGISKGTVMSRLHYARRKVQQLLIASGTVAAPRRAGGAPEQRGCEA